MDKIFNNELSAQAYNKVRAMIMSKELAPGQKIVQDKLAETLGISRTPLRSALQMLEGEGLIESIPRKGVIVKEFSDIEIVEIFDCRMALEGTAVRLFTNHARPSEINDLRKLFSPFLNGGIDDSAYQQADAKFHDMIMKGSGNGFLHRLFQQGNLLVCMDLIGLLRLPDETLPEHMAIIEAIEKRDPDLAESLAKEHLDKTKQLILKKINE
ncbi:GntR family transcriptional regulator [Flavivirga rizhaonensis]|uniref:GntR family transcriptional regulator n=1 Tax=Flavivirga rizhaonensis TaxID=2559571 RepID=A0A4S1DTF6_9FLAO|nr:GntR family transcriptional regulator [Flavivirga rizhaonensis]TGV01311.1 GntR family transcriptional regulator [Flavivirga rizhaonensis]